MIEAIDIPQPVKTYRIDYTNYRNERKVYTLSGLKFWEGESPYYKGVQILFDATDVERNVMRTFALKNVHAWDVPRLAERPEPTTRVLTVFFPVPVHLPLGFTRQLDALVDGVCQEWMRDHPSEVMWPAGAGAQMSGVHDPEGPVFDDSVYQIDVASREDTGGNNPWNPKRTELAAELRAEHKKRKAEREDAARRSSEAGRV